MKFRSIAALAAASALAVTLSVTPAQAHSNNHSHHSPKPPVSNVKTLTDGLISPLKVAFGPHGSLLVAESFAGQLSSVSKTGVKKVIASAPGSEIAGVSYANGTTYYFENSSPAPDVAGPAVLKTIKNGKTRSVTDLLKFEKKHNPDANTVYGVRDVSKSCLAQSPAMQSKGEMYSHPYSTAPSRNGLYVGDAGANVILNVSHHGKVKLVKKLPAEPVMITKKVQAEGAANGMNVPDCMLGHNYYAQPVPTDIEVVGNWLYYTVLPGVPGESFSAGKAYRMHLKSHRTELLAKGLSAPTGIAVDHRGRVYVSELMGAGVSMLSHGKKTTVLPAMMAADVEIGGRTLAVTTNALVEPPATGNVMTARIR
ncbi:hypothetical protein CQ018_10600 [Arthrobacter sp. MYb227]|uniref:ScyD/ScyE family protein n=1 Tax=Arthrobacter sp. MYb227 TaxID=1848601 RepID=UPI000CFD2842|nr:ScyD/ScyE family protein [Arthrobacter sp. MYb227]PQZ92913.1 hypothetical protein CQ018_10600 [Arthrobacter sp. MYb227]